MYDEKPYSRHFSKAEFIERFVIFSFHRIPFKVFKRWDISNVFYGIKIFNYRDHETKTNDISQTRGRIFIEDHSIQLRILLTIVFDGLKKWVSGGSTCSFLNTL